MGVLHKKVSQILASIDFSSGELQGKPCQLDNINLGQTSHLNLDKFGINNDVMGYRLAMYV